MNGITRVGPGDAPPVVFLHGGVINRQMWLPVIEELGDDFLRVAVDLPAHGDLRDEPFSRETARGRIVDVLAHLGLKSATLVGLSLGGYVALDVAGAWPDKADGLVLSGATVDYRGWDGISTRLYGLVFPIVSRKAEKAFAEKLTTDVEPRHAREVLTTGLSVRGGGQTLRRIPGVDYAADLGDFTKPILIANGERDTQNRAGEHRFVTLHPHTRSVVIDDAGHACALQQPAAYAEAVRSLMNEVVAA